MVKIRDCTACAWCLAGAVMFVSDDWLESIEVISEALQAYTSDPIVEACGVAAWNDAPMRTFADVRNFLQAVAA